MLELHHISFDFADKPLLHGVKFSLPAGKLLHLQGANGTGKTTLLKIISGLLAPTSGRIDFEGISIQQSIKSYQQQICFVGHKLGYNLSLTPRQNCYFDLRINPKQTCFNDGIASLALSGLEDIPCAQLSAGQRRRVALLRLILSNTRMWILDEPFVALDTSAQSFLQQQLKHHLWEGGSIILTSHQPITMPQGVLLEYLL
jgi:heme exporter protein A